MGLARHSFLIIGVRGTVLGLYTFLTMFSSVVSSVVWNVTDFFFGFGGGVESDEVTSGALGAGFSLVTEELVMAEELPDEDWDDSFEAEGLPCDEPMIESEDGFISKLFPVDDVGGVDDFSLLVALASVPFRGHSSSSFRTVCCLSLFCTSLSVFLF